MKFKIKKKKNRNNTCKGVQREHNKKLNNGLPILHKVPPKRDYGWYFCIVVEKGAAVVKMWSNQEKPVRKQVKNLCEVVAYAMHSSGKNSLAVGLSPYKIAKIDAFASKLAGRLFSPFCMVCSVHTIFTK